MDDVITDFELREKEITSYIQKLITERCIQTKSDIDVRLKSNGKLYVKWHIDHLPYWDSATFENFEEFINWLKQDI